LTLNSIYSNINVSKRNEAIVNFKGTWVKGWMGLYELNLPEPFFTLAYNAGLGSKNSQGFGMVEVVRDAETRRWPTGGDSIIHRAFVNR